MPNDLVQINNTLSSTATDEALTAAQGKTLNDKKVTGSVGTTAPTSANFLEDNAVYFQYNATSNSALIQTLLNAVYPVGCYYWSSDSTNPGSLFGGTWTQIKDRFVLAAGDTYTVGATGGAASVTSGGTALTTDQIPAHTHGQSSLTGHFDSRPMSNRTAMPHAHAAGIVSGGTGDAFSSGSGGFSYAAVSAACNMQRININATHTHTSVGGGAAHTHSVNIMPPYEVAYCWKRTG